MVSLGFGKFARSDRIYALEPLRGDERGDGRRTRVWVEGVPEPDRRRSHRAHDPARHGPGRRVEGAARRGRARPRRASGGRGRSRTCRSRRSRAAGASTSGRDDRHRVLKRRAGTRWPRARALPTTASPAWFTRNIFNPAVAGLTRLGISVWGSRVLEVPGRSSGEPRRTPVNLLVVGGQEYLVAARGETQWVRNVRANEGRLELLLGKKRTQHVATELPDGDRPAILRPYLKRWKAEVGAFFDGARRQLQRRGAARHRTEAPSVPARRSQ